MADELTFAAIMAITELEDERLDLLHARNDKIERELAKINRHFRREEFSGKEEATKHNLLTELNNVVDEIERLETTARLAELEGKGDE